MLRMKKEGEDRMNVCLYGASSDTVDAAYLDAARQLGALLAGAGHTVVFGGGKRGLMGAAARGVRGAGGSLIGVAPTFFQKQGVLDDQCTQFVYTETMRQRKQYMEEHSDAFVMMPGGIGTFEEFFEILTLRQLGRHQKPIAVLNTRGYYDALQQLLRQAVDQGFLQAAHAALYTLCDTPAQVVETLETAVGG